jgi:hypothetical protein
VVDLATGFLVLCYTYLEPDTLLEKIGSRMFEHRRQPLIPPHEFLIRQLIYLFVALMIITGSLLLGMAGYHYLEHLSWIDALVNAAMLLGGMGPVNELHTNAGKLFASFYALYSGIVFLVSVGVILAPMYHRFLHRFHLEIEES